MFIGMMKSLVRVQPIAVGVADFRAQQAVPLIMTQGIDAGARRTEKFASFKKHQSVTFW